MNIEELLKNGTPLTQAQKIIAARDKMMKIQKDLRVTEERIELTEKTNLEDIRGIGQATAQKLLSKGIKTEEDLLALGLEGVKEIITSPIALKALKENLFNKKED